MPYPMKIIIFKFYNLFSNEMCIFSHYYINAIAKKMDNRESSPEAVDEAFLFKFFCFILNLLTAH